ncbi:hypothetical protein BgAZ_302870 [Babesia gibsoni]|uniref:Uncharacterized protein n=1 Tax=Babesia gibsoni TaxID=33632 RepID=A0AAD8LIE5_BABGI|nr:hypothetical protein BgAZ_302870 [Babesia gibsoni]
MKYLLGGSTGLIKEVETATRSLRNLLPLEGQNLDRKVSCMSWSGGPSGDEETELTVGRDDGSVEVYAYPAMERKAAVKLDSKCLCAYILLNKQGTRQQGLYHRGLTVAKQLYPDPVYFEKGKAQEKYLCCVFQNGFCLVINYGDLLKHAGKGDNDRKVKVTYVAPAEDNGESISLPGLVIAYKFKGPISAAQRHSVLSNRLVMGGHNIAPFLFDLYTGSILWSGKMPHGTLLGLQSTLDVKCICFLEDLGPDLIAVSTSDSYIYLYDFICQRKPVYDMNICDRRSQRFTAKHFLGHDTADYSAMRKKELKQSVNEFYTSSSRSILKLATIPRKWDMSKGEEFHCSTDLIASDNVGSIYHLKVLTGDALYEVVEKKLKKYQPNETMTMEKVSEYIIKARKRFGSASANDRLIHCAPPNYQQFVCQVKGCYNIHNGAVVDISCNGKYLITAGLDRFTNVYQVSRKVPLFHMYCNQKQTCVIPFPGQFFETYDTSEFKELENGATETKSTKKGERDAMDIDNELPSDGRDYAISASDYSDESDDSGTEMSESDDVSEGSDDEDYDSDDGSD